MKAYLIVMLILACFSFVPKDEEKPTATVKALAGLIRLGVFGWTIYLLAHI